MGPNNTLVAYSDGIAECRNESGVEFGTERLLTELQAFSNRSPGATLFSVLAAVENFAGNGHREDDIALLVLHRLDSCATEETYADCKSPEIERRYRDSLCGPNRISSCQRIVGCGFPAHPHSGLGA